MDAKSFLETRFDFRIRAIFPPNVFDNSLTKAATSISLPDCFFYIFISHDERLLFS